MRCRDASWLTLGLLVACSERKGADSGSVSSADDTATESCEADQGCLLTTELPYGLLSVQAMADDDVWIVGSSPKEPDGTGPAILHLSGDAWERLDTSAWEGAELWWAWIQEDEAIFVGNQGLILELDMASGTLTRMEGPTEDVTFFGVWGATSEDVWAVGMTGGGEGPRALWRRVDGVWSAWVDDDLGEGPDGLVYFKVHGTASDDVWMVGTAGTTAHFDGSRLVEVATPSETAPLLTVDASPAYPVAVGGAGNGLLLEFDGSQWLDKSPEFQPGLNGVCSRADVQWAVGQHGSRAMRLSDGTWESDMDRGFGPLTYEDWHGCAVTPSGALWSVGGRIAARPLTNGVIGFQGKTVPPDLEY